MLLRAKYYSGNRSTHSFLLLLYHCAFDDYARGRQEPVSVPVVLLSHRQIFRQIVLITCGFRSLELLVALLLVLHVVESARVLQILVLRVIVVGSA